jgi:hypothetical protein
MRWASILDLSRRPVGAAFRNYFGLSLYRATNDLRLPHVAM